jgi:micrococcal nuclease
MLGALLATSISLTLAPDNSRDEPIQTAEPRYQISRVIDGDTVQLTVRVLGIDAEESVHPTKPATECGKQAAEFAKRTLTGQRVWLVVDPKAGSQDRYGRALRVVLLSDGSSYAETLLTAGLARENGYGKPYAAQARYRQLQDEARKAHRGCLWGAP